MTTFEEYSEKAYATKIYPDQYKIIYPSLGLAEEAGEVCGKIKKIIRDNNAKFTEEKKKEIIFEMGDQLWYLNALAKDLGYTLQQVAELNIEKIESRRERNKIGGSGDKR